MIANLFLIVDRSQLNKFLFSFVRHVQQLDEGSFEVESTLTSEGEEIPLPEADLRANIDRLEGTVSLFLKLVGQKDFIDSLPEEICICALFISEFADEYVPR